MLINKLKLNIPMIEKKKLLLILTVIFCIVAGILMIVKASLVQMRFQQVSEMVIGLGSTFEEKGIISSLAYLSGALTIIVGILAILGSLIAFKEVKVKEIQIGPIILLVLAVFTWIGIYIPVINTGFEVDPYFFTVEIDLIETLIGIGEPIILTLAAVLALVAIYVIS